LGPHLSSLLPWHWDGNHGAQVEGTSAIDGPLPLSALESHHQAVVGRLLLLPLVLGDALTVDRAVFGNSGCLTGFCVFGSCMFGSLFANY
jgi:hypothetical protein